MGGDRELEGLHVLVVDDEEAVGELVQANFRARGARVSTVLDAAAGMAAVVAGGIDAVVLDLMLPGKSGLDLLPELRAVEPNLPVVMLSAHGSIDVAVKALQAGAWSFIEKPFRGAHLARTVAQAVAASRAHARVERAEARATVAEELVAAQARQRRLEQQLLMQERLVVLGNLAAGIAHEVNNPLAYVEKALETLHGHRAAIEAALGDRLGTKTAPQDHAQAVEALADLGPCIAEALDGVGRVRAVVEAVRMSAQPAAGGRRVEDLAELARAAVLLVRNRFLGRARLTVELAPARVSCDGSRLVQVLVHLLNHSAEVVGGRDGRAWVSSGTTAGSSWLEVADDGPGVPEEAVADVFTRGGAPIRPGFPGLGLAAARDLVEEQGGELHVASRIGGGAAFRLELGRLG